MNNVKQNTLKEFWAICSNVQTLQKKAEEEQICSKKRLALHSQLEKLQSSLDILRQQATFAQESFKEVEKQIVSLYRTIEDKFDAYEISHISGQALALCSSMESGQVIRLAKRMDELLHSIQFLFQHRRPSFQHRKIIHIILKLTEEAKAILGSKNPLSKAQTKTLHLLKMLLREAILQAEKAVDPTRGELALNLYEIGELFYQKKDKEAHVRLNLIYPLLSTEQRKQLTDLKDDSDVYPIEA